jgi:hypothetical protein
MLDQQSRALRTRDKARRGALPAAAQHNLVDGAGDGRPCDGCDQPIHPAAKVYIVTPTKWLPLWFHQDCYRAWMTSVR